VEERGRVNRKILLAASVGLLLAACGTSGLSPLVLDGHELYASLVTQQIDDVPRLHVPRAVLRGNPQLSTDAEFVGAIAGAGSQGQLGGEGIRAALYALYRGESEAGSDGSEAESTAAADRLEILAPYGGQNQVGLYGLEAASTADADRLEGDLRGVWAHNVSLDRVRVHRGGKLLVVVWTYGVSASCWEAVNAAVVERLPAPGVPVGPAATNPRPREPPN
jgi:hypothetical protein